LPDPAAGGMAGTLLPSRPIAPRRVGQMALSKRGDPDYTLVMVSVQAAFQGQAAPSGPASSPARLVALPALESSGFLFLPHEQGCDPRRGEEGQAGEKRPDPGRPARKEQVPQQPDAGEDTEGSLYLDQDSELTPLS
jgi:hypothetical protein